MRKHITDGGECWCEHAHEDNSRKGLISQLERAESALKMYADRAHWSNKTDDPLCYFFFEGEHALEPWYWAQEIVGAIDTEDMAERIAELEAALKDLENLFASAYSANERATSFTFAKEYISDVILARIRSALEQKQP